MSKAAEKAAAKALVLCMGMDARVSAREEPDIELTFSDGRKVGLEITEPHVQSQAAGAAVVKRLCDRLRNELRSRGIVVGVVLTIPMLYMNISTLGPRPLARLVRLLADLVEADAPAVVHAGQVDHDRSALSALDIEEISKVTVYKGEVLRVGPKSLGPGSGRGVVQFRIEDKNQKLGAYRRNMPGAEQWLLLVTGRTGSSAVWSAILEDRFVSAFDRTFCLDTMARRAFKVDTVKG